MAEREFELQRFQEQRNALLDEQAKRFEKQNPLAKYHSYSYRHLLFACETTDAMDLIEDQGFSEIIESGQRFFDSGERYGKFVLLINGFYDTHYMIESVNTKTHIDKLEDVNLTAQEITLSIREIYGANLLNDLAEIGAYVGKSPEGIPFLLKTIFVGHTSDGDVDFITNITPIAFKYSSMTAAFDASGATYTLEGAPTNNSAANFPLYGQVGKVSFDIGGTLENAISNLQDALNRSVERTKKKIDPDDQKDIVEYQINLDDKFKDPSYRIDNTKEQFFDAENTTKLTAGKGSVLKKIQRVLSTSHKLIQEAQSEYGEDDESIHLPKIQTVVEIKKRTSGQRVHKVTYNILSQKRQLARDRRKVQNNPDQEINEQVKQALHLSYIYSGSNTEVLNLDMKWDTVIPFLTAVSPASMLKSKQQVVENEQSSNPEETIARQTKENTYSLNLTANTANTDTVGSEKVATNNAKVGEAAFPSDTEIYYAMMHYAVLQTNTKLDIEIRGNPLLYNDFNRMPSEADSLHENDLKTKVFYNDWEKTPAFIKVDIYFPNNGLNAKNQQFQAPGHPVEQQLVPFWYQDYYYIRTIENNFENGDFRQTLTVHPFPDSTPSLQSSRQGN